MMSKAKSEMRFLINISDLRVFRHNKYTRVLRSLLTEIETVTGLPVELSDCSTKLIFAEVPQNQEQLVASVWWHAIPYSWPMQPNEWGQALELHIFYFWAKLTRLSSRKVKDDRTWHFAYSIEIFSPSWRKRIASVLDLDSDSRRRALFYLWLEERGFMIDACDKACSQDRVSQPVAIREGDILVLAGASWQYDIVVLEKLKAASGLRLVCLIYDLLPIDYPSFVTVRQRARYKKFLSDIGRFSELIVTPSKTTALRLKAFYETQCIQPPAISPISISCAALSKSSGETTQRLRQLRLSDKKFMLCASDLRERKHILWLYSVCAKLHHDLPDFPVLIFTGRVTRARILAILSDEPSWNNVAMLIEDPLDEELSWLYANAMLCLQPAFEGGIGMAVMEAVQAGRHCITADAPSLIEASGGLAEHLPRDEVLWAAAIRRRLESGDEINSALGTGLPPPAGILAQIGALLEKEQCVFSIKAQSSDVP